MSRVLVSGAPSDDASNHSTHETYEDLKQVVDNSINPSGGGGKRSFTAFSDRAVDAADIIQQNAAVRLLEGDSASAEREVVEQTVSSFADSCQAIVRALDVVQQAHPFVAVVVLALKAAMELELTRRENDAKVLLIKSRMLDAVEVLIDLKDIKSASKPDADGTTLEGRLRPRLRAMAKDIRDCSAVCEKYVQKRFIVKLFDGGRWQNRLAEYDAVFSNHRANISLTLASYTARGVVDLRSVVDEMKGLAESTRDTTSTLLLFKQLERPKERELLRFIETHGGADACAEDEKIFAELQVKMKEGADQAWDTFDVQDIRLVMAAIRLEMRSDLGHALAEDRQDFNNKFDAVQIQLAEMKNSMRLSEERVITAPGTGPHYRLIDPDMQHIWKDMAWKTRVKGRDFVAAIHDHFFEKCFVQENDVEYDALCIARGRNLSSSASLLFSRRIGASPARSTNASQSRQSSRSRKDFEDRWALRYIAISRLRPILEAFDPDATGWVTVRDVNAFTTSRPDGYSVLKWIAFWSVGFRLVSAQYARKALSQRARMMRLAKQVLPCNRARVERYLSSSSLTIIDCLLHGLNSVDHPEDDSDVLYRFNDFVDAEYARVEQNLDLYQWHIDMSNTMSLIMDNRPIEHLVIPLLTLLLQRHADIMNLAATFPLNDLELYDAQKSLETVAQGVYYRMATLISSYENQSLDPKSQFTHALHGMFSSLYHWHLNKSVHLHLHEQTISGDSARPEPEPDARILVYGISSCDMPEQFYASDNAANASFGGIWAGYYLSVDGNRQGWLGLTLCFHADDTISGNGQDTIGKFTITGTLTARSDANGMASNSRVVLRKAYVFSGRRPIWRYVGELQRHPDRISDYIQGSWGAWSDGDEDMAVLGSFRLSRGASPLIRQPSLHSTLPSARQRWNMALRSVKNDIRRRSWSWSFFRQRLLDRKAAVEAHMRLLIVKDPHRYSRIWPISHDGSPSIVTRWTYEDEAFRRFLAERRLNLERVEVNVKCVYCDATPTHARYRCVGGESITDCYMCLSPSFTGSDRVIMKSSRAPYACNIGRISTASPAYARRAVIPVSHACENQRRDAMLVEHDSRSLHRCGNTMTQSSWCCTECASETFICEVCTSRQGSIQLVAESAMSNATLEARLSVIEQSMERIEHRIALGTRICQIWSWILLLFLASQLALALK